MKLILTILVALFLFVFYLSWSTEYTSIRSDSTSISINYDKTCINKVVYIVRNDGGYKGGITPYLQPNGSITSCEE